MTAKRDVKDFARLIEALHPWLNQIVVIGGWAYRLYRLHPLAQQLEYDPLQPWIRMLPFQRSCLWQDRTCTNA
jgi:hypothetical protein